MCPLQCYNSYIGVNEPAASVVRENDEKSKE